MGRDPGGLRAHAHLHKPSFAPWPHTDWQVCRESYPPLVCSLLWALCEVSIVALDLTMLLGG